MNYYDVSLNKLKALVQEEDPNWLEKAKARTENFLNLGKFEEASSIWSDVKVVFMRLQHFKCIFCDRRLSPEEYGRIEHDLEHFRPKGSVKAWPTKKIKKARNIDYNFTTGIKSSIGYYWLAYNLQNYASSCKVCNSTLKSNYFPVAKPRVVDTKTIRQLNSSEKPYLLFPLGFDDPAKYIKFDQVFCVPIKRSGHNHRRARITIDFFELNTRQDLLMERFSLVDQIWKEFEIVQENNSRQRKQRAQNSIGRLTSIKNIQTAFARHYKELCETEPDEAWDLSVKANDALNEYFL